jgi:hypothetical protein
MRQNDSFFFLTLFLLRFLFFLKSLNVVFLSSITHVEE